MERTERAIKMGLAALLLVMITALGSLAVTNAATNGGVSALLSHTTAQSVAAKPAAEVNSPTSTTNNTGTQSSSTTAQQAAPAQQQSGVADARYAARQTGPAVVTVVNTMQQQTTGRGRFGFGGQAPEALGSGVIIDN